MKRTLIAAAILALPVAGFAATAGSNTVNSAAIIDGSIVNADIANATITGAKLLSATITATQLAAGAVTDAKITGPISVGKLPVGITATTVAVGNHSHDGLYLKKYAKVAIVAKSGGDFTDPNTALSNTAQWCGSPTAQNPCLVKVMPGVYNVTDLVVNPFVTLEGSGVSTTTLNLSSTLPSTLGLANATLKDITLNAAECNMYGDNAVMTDVTINSLNMASGYFLIYRGNIADFSRVTLNSSFGAAALSIFGADGTKININDSTFKVMSSALALGTHGISFSAPATSNLVINNSLIEISDSMNSITSTALDISGGNTVLSNSKIHLLRGGNNFAVFNHGDATKFTMVSSQIVAEQGNYTDIGIMAYPSTQTFVDNSQIIADDEALRNEASTIFVGSSKLSGAMTVRSVGATTTKCVNTYDGNYNPVSCQ